MKKVTRILLSITIICGIMVSMVACGKSNKVSKPASKDETGKVSQNISNNPNSIPSVLEKVNFDLSSYDSHGNLSCGRIWVTKTESSWDSSPKRYYAYLDINGNVIYGWKEIGTVLGVHGKTEYVDDCLPLDYVNDRAIIIGVRSDSKCSLQIIDLKGNELISPEHIYIDEYDYFENGEMIYNYAYTNFDENGIFYFIGKVWWDGNTEGDRGFYFIDTTGIHRFNAKMNLSESLLNSVEKIDKYFFVKQGIYTCLFDSKGEVILNFREKANIEPYKIEMLEDHQLKAYFIGKDNKDYQCILDFNGNFLSEPILN